MRPSNSQDTTVIKKVRNVGRAEIVKCPPRYVRIKGEGWKTKQDFLNLLFRVKYVLDNATEQDLDHPNATRYHKSEDNAVREVVQACKNYIQLCVGVVE